MRAGVRMECARVRCARRCGGRRSVRPHHCARLLKPGRVDRLPPQRPTNRTPRTLHANAKIGVCMGCASMRFVGRCLGVVWVVPGRRLGI
eukprot:5903097-Lingulodinium_polyedra.AAC.1